MKRNYRLAYALIKELGYVDKEHAVFQWTAGRTTSMREMTDAEFVDMLEGLQGLKGGIAQRRAEEAEEALRTARSKALNKLQTYGINTTDWGAVNRFVSQPRISGKVFYELSIPELEALIKKMHAIIAKVGRVERSDAERRMMDSIAEQAYQDQLPS